MWIFELFIVSFAISSLLVYLDTYFFPYEVERNKQKHPRRMK